MSVVGTLKALARRALGAAVILDGLRWFINQADLPHSWREFAHRKLAKRAWFGDEPFSHTTMDGVQLRFLHTGTANYLYGCDSHPDHAATRTDFRSGRSVSAIASLHRSLVASARS